MKTINDSEKLESVVPRSAVATPQRILQLLEVTPERQAEIDAGQQALRNLFNSRARLNKEEYTKARGIELEHHHRATGNRNGYAEALAMQGRFQEAGKVAVRKDLKQEFIEKHVAVIQDDDDCKCDNFRDENGVSLPNQFVESYGWSEKHQKEMPFIRCQVCGNLNAKPMPMYLAEQKRLRAEAVTGQSQTVASEFFKKR